MVSTPNYKSHGRDNKVNTENIVNDISGISAMERTMNFPYMHHQNRTSFGIRIFDQRWNN